MSNTATDIKEDSLGGIRIGRLLGIHIEVHLSFFFLVILSFYLSFFVGKNIRPLEILFIGFISIFLHELGHAFMGRALKIPIVAIVLTALGGETKTASFPTRARDEFLLAISGPALSGLLSLSSWIWLHYTSHSWPRLIFYINLILCITNLLPAFPLDGGRILRSLFVKRLGLRQATKITGWVSLIVALAIATIGILYSYWLSLPFCGILIASISRQNDYIERILYFESYGDRVEILDEDGFPAGNRHTSLGTTYIIEEHQAEELTYWVVKDFGGNILLVTDTPLREKEKTASSPLPQSQGFLSAA